MSKLLISLLFFFLIVYSYVILWMYYREWKEKCKYKKESIEQEHEIEMKQLEINKLKHELAKIKQSLYNDDKEDRNGRNKNFN